MGSNILGLHGRSNAHANPRSRQRLRNRHRKLARKSPTPPFPISLTIPGLHILGSSITYRTKGTDLEVLLSLRR
jgi:hypothetical protein